MSIHRFIFYGFYLMLFSCDILNSKANDIITNAQGGQTTVLDASSNAFSYPAPNLGYKNLNQHLLGDVAFEAVFVTAPAPVNGGLGPLFNNTSCLACHAKDGRGRPPYPGEAFNSMLFRTSMKGMDLHGGPTALPFFGKQLQMRAIFGFEPEVSAYVTYKDSVGTFADGDTWNLSIPQYHINGIKRSFPASAMISPRTAPAVFGLGLLEAIPARDIYKISDPEDLNNDGISGKPNEVWDVVNKKYTLGRFGWKANTPNLFQQSAAAYNNDMGITSWVFPQENCEGTLPECPQNSGPEIDSGTLAAVTMYVQTLAVPAQRNTGKKSTHEGKKILNQLQCHLCHVEQFVTEASYLIPELANQKIQPYTDLLLHDMGPALSDQRPDFKAHGNEWRTPPLWGIGLIEVVNGHTRLLHDGRARNLEEAILWHGGEAQKSSENYQKLSKYDRNLLLEFLASL